MNTGTHEFCQNIWSARSNRLSLQTYCSSFHLICSLPTPHNCTLNPDVHQQVDHIRGTITWRGDMLLSKKESCQFTVQGIGKMTESSALQMGRVIGHERTLSTVLILSRLLSKQTIPKCIRFHLQCSYEAE